MEADARNQGHENIPERSCRQHVGEIGPGESRRVGGKKGQQEKYSDSDPGIENREEKAGDIVEGDASELFHAARQ